MELRIGLSSNNNSLGDTCIVKLGQSIGDISDDRMWNIAEAIRANVDEEFSNGTHDTVIGGVSKIVSVPVEEPV